MTKRKKKLLLKAKIAPNGIDMETTNDFPGRIDTESGRKSAENLIKSFSIMMGTYKTEEAAATFITPEGRHAVRAVREGDVINVYEDTSDLE